MSRIHFIYWNSWWPFFLKLQSFDGNVVNTNNKCIFFFFIWIQYLFGDITSIRCDPLVNVINHFVCQTILINVLSVSLYSIFSHLFYSLFHVIAKMLLHKRYIYYIVLKIDWYFCETNTSACRYSTTSSTRSATSRASYGRSYDLYDAQADASREQRTQFLLGTIAACEIICIGPLMVLR